MINKEEFIQKFAERIKEGTEFSDYETAISMIVGAHLAEIYEKISNINTVLTCHPPHSHGKGC